MKTKLGNDAGLSTPAYVATPRPTLNQKLGFDVPTDASSEEAPNFDKMMAQLSGSLNTQSSNEPKE